MSFKAKSQISISQRIGIDFRYLIIIEK